MSIPFTHEWAFGSRFLPVSPARTLSHLHRQKCRVDFRSRQTSSHEKEKANCPSSTLTNRRAPATGTFHDREKQRLRRYPIIGFRRSLDYQIFGYSFSSYSRRFSSRVNGGESQDANYIVTREELKSLVGEHGEAEEQEGLSQPSDLRSLRWEDETAVSPPGRREVDPRDAIRFARELNTALRDVNTPHTRLWEIYQCLPEPRALFLQANTLARLLARLQAVEYKSTPGMLRFLALISDMKKSSLAIPLHAWNSAISFAGRCLKKITANEVESALRIWREMENVAGVSSNNVTFNILFDIATKARKFVLAEMILSEMAARQLTYNRYFRTGLIYYYGLRANGNNVRRAYSELVDAGEIVDTAVINCVIGALINCGETAAADLLFERSKQLHASKTDPQLPPSHWRDRRRMGRTLNDAVETLRHEGKPPGSPDSPAATHLAQVRERTSVAPDLTTYKLFIKQYAVVLGDIDRAAQLVDEMEQYGIAVHGSIFRHIFEAFVIHGGVLYTLWSRKRLENTWLAFVEALDANAAREEETPAEETHAEPEPTYEGSNSMKGPPFFLTNEDIRRQSVHSGIEESQFENPEQGMVPTKTEEGDYYNSLKGFTPVNNGKPLDKPERIIQEVMRPESLEDPNGLLEPGIVEAAQSLAKAEHERNVYIGRAMAELIGRAFAKCTNLGRTVEVWAEIRNRWSPEVYDDALAVEAEIAALFPGNEQLFAEMVDRELQKPTRW